jgi:hypothetical protein
MGPSGKNERENQAHAAEGSISPEAFESTCLPQAHRSLPENCTVAKGLVSTRIVSVSNN